MEPEIIDTAPLVLVGFSFFGDPFRISGGWTEENEIGRLWSRWMAYLTDHQEDIQGLIHPSYHYEVHIDHAETFQKGEYEVFVGRELEAAAPQPAAVSIKILPATRYAVFTLQGALITGDWGRPIYQEWLPQSGYTAYPYTIERYDERFKGLERIEESALDILVPLK
ncbi:MAG: GyrI-like domain-containing protein [Anaerolineae bacterium]|nr:GyrI-like domain-containing protein [Anaerolineae bacterium]